MADTVRTVEIGEILPRAGEPRWRLPPLRVLLPAAALLVFAGVIVLSPLAGAILELVAGIDPASGGAGDALALAKAIVALALAGISLALVGRSVRRPGESSPRVPGHVDLLSLATPDVERAGAHLAGQHEGCDRPRGLAAGEIVIARITDESADRLEEIPHECRRRRRESGLFPVLLGVPNAEREVVTGVSDAYQTTLLIDPAATARLPALLGLLAHLCGSPHREEATGIGGPSLKCIELDGHGPTDPDLQDEIREGLGEPLAHEAEEARTRDQPPAVTLLAAPPAYLEAAIESLPDRDGTVVPVRIQDHQRIQVARLFVDAEPSAEDIQWVVREAVIQGAPGGA